MLPALETGRLTLRPFVLGDARFVLGLLNEPSFLLHIGDKGVRTEDEARRYIAEGPLASYARSGYGLYVVALREGGAPIGICGLLKRDWLEDVDLGFALLPPYCGHGYAFEAASAVLAQARDPFGLRRIVAITSLENESSIRLLGRLGFRFQRVARFTAGGEELRLFALDT